MTYTYPAEVVYERNAERRRLMEERDALLVEVRRLQARVAQLEHRDGLDVFRGRA